MTSKAPKVERAILCDDIRQEMNGKYIFIGVYSGDVLVPHFPMTMAFSAYVDFIPAKFGEQNIHIRLVGADGPMSGLEGKIGIVDGAKTVGMATPPLPVLIAKPSDVILEISFDNRKWTQAVKKAVRLAP